MSFGKCLEEIMEERNLTGETVGIDSGIGPSAVSRIIRGRRNPTPEQIARLCLYLGVSFEEMDGFSILSKAEQNRLIHKNRQVFSDYEINDPIMGKMILEKD